MQPAVWIGPAIIAAIISSVVTVASWFVSQRADRRREAERRRERVQDVQMALLAEVIGNRVQHARIDLEAHASEIQDRMSADPDYTPFVPRDASTIVFDAILSDIHVLPGPTILPVVSHYKQVARIAHFADDLKSDNFRQLSAGRRFEMYVDYLQMILQALEQAASAEQALRGSLGAAAGTISNPASGRQSALGSASDSAANRASSSSPPS